MDYEQIDSAYRELKKQHLSSNDVNSKLDELIDKMKEENDYLKNQLINAEKQILQGLNI